MPEKDANLRLELWAIDPHQPNKKYLLDYSDSNVDNVEHIYCRTAALYTNYEIAVSFSDTNSQSSIAQTQLYSLAWNISNPPLSDESDNIFWHDLNADGIVNDLDFTILFDNSIASLKSPESYLLGDINSDGRIDTNDIQIFLEYKNRRSLWYTAQQNKPNTVAQSNVTNKTSFEPFINTPNINGL
jgi:hypothetical protein